MTSMLSMRPIGLSGRLGRCFNMLRPPLQLEGRPSPGLFAWMHDVASFLRFLDAVPNPQESWRFTLVQSTLLNDELRCQTLLPLGPRRRSLIVSLTRSLRVALNEEAGGGEKAVTLDPLCGLLLNVGEHPAHWWLEDELEREADLLLALSVAMPTRSC
jgi:hypothetical protein